MMINMSRFHVARRLFTAARKYGRGIPVIESAFDPSIPYTQNADREFVLFDQHKSNPTGLVELLRGNEFGSFLIASTPSTLKEVFRLDAKGLIGTKWPTTNHHLLGFDVFSNIPPHDARHRETRTFLNPFFMDTALRDRFDLVRFYAERFVHSLCTARQQQILPLAQKFAFDVVMGITFGDEIFTESVSVNMFSKFGDFTNAFSDLDASHVDKADTLLGRGMIARNLLLDDIRVLIERSIQLYKQEKLDTKSIVFKIIDGRLFHKGDVDDMTDDEWRRFKDAILLLTWAGHDTTASSACNLLYCLHQFGGDEFVKRMQHELNQNEHKLDCFEFVSANPMLDAFVKETVRYVPVVPFVPKLLREDMTVNACPLHKGEVFLQSAPMTALNNNVFGDNAAKFSPQRFIDEPPSKQVWYPFGSGTKMCIGWKLAYMELKVLTSLIVNMYAVELDVTQLQKSAVSFWNFYDIHGRLAPKTCTKVI